MNNTVDEYDKGLIKNFKVCTEAVDSLVTEYQKASVKKLSDLQAKLEKKILDNLFNKFMSNERKNVSIASEKRPKSFKKQNLGKRTLDFRSYNPSPTIGFYDCVTEPVKVKSRQLSPKIMSFVA
jgi:hypothetical protein